jgi:hypothetical protein
MKFAEISYLEDSFIPFNEEIEPKRKKRNYIADTTEESSGMGITDDSTSYYSDTSITSIIDTSVTTAVTLASVIYTTDTSVSTTSPQIPSKFNILCFKRQSI